MAAAETPRPKFGSGLLDEIRRRHEDQPSEAHAGEPAGLADGPGPMARGYELLRVEPDPRPEPVVERESDSELERLRRALEEREAALSQATAESAELRRRLEATELGRSAREQALQDSEQERAKPRAGDQPPQALESSHLVFVPRGGSYELLERTGPPPDVGEKVAEGENRDKRFLVAKVARSPLPLDPRACAYLCALD